MDVSTQTRDKEKKLAYVLSEECQYRKSDIARMMDVSSQSISAWVKDIGYEVKIHNLEKDIASLKVQLEDKGYKQPKKLEHKNLENIINIKVIR